jgi:catechol 2,3-dioxygenase-like lactoylglutathione lyase family enzyme
MEPRLNVITLAVEDLERALTFYRDGLGFQSPGVIGSEWTDERTGANGAVALFQLEGGLLLSLYPRSDLAKDAEIPVGVRRAASSASASSSRAAPMSTSS